MKKWSEKLNESKGEIIDMEKFIKICDAISVLCDGEYGDVFYNKEELKIFICLGDSNPFDMEYLEQSLSYTLCDNSSDANLLAVEVDNESYPCAKGADSKWEIYKKGKFVKW